MQKPRQDSLSRPHPLADADALEAPAAPLGRPGTGGFSQRTFCGVALGTFLLYAALIGLQPFIDRTYGLHIAIDPPTQDQLAVLGGIVLAGFVAGLLPALRAYRLSLADGMTVRT